MKRALEPLIGAKYGSGGGSSAARFFALSEWVALLLDSCLEVQLLGLLLRLSKKVRTMLGDYLRLKEDISALEPLFRDIYTYRTRFSLSHIYDAKYYQGTGCFAFLPDPGVPDALQPILWCLPGRLLCVEDEDDNYATLQSYEWASLTASYMLGQPDRENESRTDTMRHIFGAQRWDELLQWHAVADVLCISADQRIAQLHREKRRSISFFPCDQGYLLL
jgi:hypothetical protein